jgi:lipooligosaccharide transport system permease protein
LVIGVMFLFSGVFFPLEGLPGWVGWAAWFLPLTHAVILMRGLTSGALAPSMWLDLAWLVAFTLLVFWLAVRLIRRRLIR